MFTVPTMASAIDYPGWHSLSAEKLSQIQPASANHAAVLKTMSARAVGRQDIEAGIALLEQVESDQTNVEAQLYWQSIACVLHLQNGDLTRATDFCQQLERVSDVEQVHPSVTALVFGALGGFATRKGQAQEALALMDQGLEHAIESNDRSLLALLHHNRSLPLVMLGMTDLAISSLETSRRYQDAVPEDSQLPAVLLHNLGYVQAQRGGHEDAIQQFAKVVEWAVSLDQLSRAFIAATQWSHSLTALGRADEAVQLLLPWIQRDDFSSTADARADAFRALGSAYLAQSDHANAEYYLKRGLDIARAQSNPVRVAQLSLSWIGFQLKTQQYEAAVTDLTTLLVDTPETSALRVQALLQMSQAQQALGNYALAWHYLDEHRRVDAAARMEDFDRRLSALRAANDLDLANYELAASRERERVAFERSEQDRLNRNIVLLAAALACIIGFLLYRRGLERRDAKLQARKTQELQITLAERTQDIQSETDLRVAAEKVQSELEQRIADDERLRTVGQLTGGVAHDFNNLLTVILMSADLLKAQGIRDPEGLLEDIVQAGESGKATTQSLLSYARQQELQPETIDLQEFLKRRTPLFKRTLGDEIGLQIIADTTRLIAADPGKLTTGLINLLFNAREAMDEQGLVQIFLEPEAGDRVAIVVSDTGAGMSSEVMSRAFEPFYTTKQDGGGSGLGLSMVYGFVKQTGGELTLCSGEMGLATPGFNTSIRLSFKTVTSHSKPIVASVELPQQSVKPRLALLVEDQIGVREVCKAALSRRGFEVVEAENGVEALELVETNPGFDLVVSDALMPGGVSGVDVAKFLETSHPDVPVVLMSGGPVEPPANSVFLMKPFALAELDATVQQLLADRESRTGS